MPFSHAVLALACDDEAGGLDPDHENGASGAQLDQITGICSSPSHPSNVLSIGVARVAKVDPSESGDLNFAHRNRHLKKAEISAARNRLGYQSRRERLDFFSTLYCFQNIQGQFVNRSWCFT
jgi:hypothetical protein